MSQQLPILSAKELFAQLKLDPLMNDWRSLAGMDNKVFDKLILEPLNRFAEAVQLAPASEAHHHSGPGGLLRHTIDVITIALKKRRGLQLPLGGSISDISDQKHLWTYGVFVACLLHDIGKLSANTRLILLLKDGNEKPWTPHDEPINTIKNASSYRIQFEKTRYDYHHRIALTHFDFISRMARAWMAQAPAVMEQVCAYLWGDRFESGIIGEIAEAADRESTARDLKLPAEQRFSDAVSAIDRYLRMIRQWISDGAIRINVNGGMGWVDNEGNLYLVCRSLAEKIIQECTSLGLKNLPQDHVRIYDILQEHGYAKSTPEGKAIWTIQVKTASFTHQFTCMKFEARKLTAPTKLLSPLEGEIKIAEDKHCESGINTQEAIVQDAVKNCQHETEQNTGEENAAQPLEITQEHEEETETERKQPENITVENEESSGSEKITHDSAEESAMQTHDAENNIPTISAEGSDTPRQFVQWLKRGLIEKSILINDVNAEVHIVEEGIFLLAPAIFKTFLNKHGLPGESQHKNLSRRFARQRLHIKADDGLNIHTYWVRSSNRATKINGWLLPFNVIYEHDYPIPNPNKYFRRSIDA